MHAEPNEVKMCRSVGCSLQQDARFFCSSTSFHNQSLCCRSYFIFSSCLECFVCGQNVVDGCLYPKSISA
jgi:hypothetical protein